MKTRKLRTLAAVIAALGIATLSLAGCPVPDGNDTNNGNGNETPAHVHQWGEWVQTKAPTETADGEENRTCTLNSAHKETRPIAALNHVHQWGEWAQTKAPTETADGEETRTCTLNSAHTETRPIAALNHTHQWGEWTETTAPTCTEAGAETRVCALNATHTETQAIAINPDAHEWEWVVTTSATYTAEGVETKTCKHDPSHTDGTQTIPQLVYTASSLSDLGEWLARQTDNTADTAYKAKLNVNNLGGSYVTDGSAGKTLTDNSTKYVSLDLSGSTFTSISDNAFTYCTSLAGVIIPNGVTSIGLNAFWGCTSLTSVTIPASVTSIENSAFPYSGLTEINVDAANTVYSSVDGVLYNKPKTTLIKYPARKTGAFTIPDGVTTIGEQAFWDCTGLASVTIGNGVTTIGDDAFYACISLTAIDVDSANSAYSSADGILYNKNKTTLINYPAKKADSTFTIPNSVTTIGRSAFYGSDNLTSVTIPNSVTTIGTRAFDATRFTSITIPDSVASIGNQAFYRTSLTNITIPNSVTTIGTRAFSLSYSLTSVTFERADTTIDDNSFPEGSSLKTAYTAGGIGTYTRPNTSSTTWTKQE